jgi:hypothetical protein
VRFEVSNGVFGLRILKILGEEEEKVWIGFFVVRKKKNAEFVEGFRACAVAQHSLRHGATM